MNKKIWLILIFALAFFLRFYKLGDIPNGLYQDETAIGYNAYSLLETGRDEHGRYLPLYFESFGDWKLPIYIYLTVISVKLFGLTEFAVRFPSALFGTLTVPLLYVFIKELFKKRRVAVLTSLLLAINPWHLHYSRATFEVTIALFLFILGGLLIFHKKLLFGTVSFILVLYSYNLTRLLAPLLYGLFIIYYRKRLIGVEKKNIILTVIISLILLLPFIKSFFASEGIASAYGTFIFTSAQVQAPLLEFRSYFVRLPVLFTKIFFNRFILTAWQYLQNLISYLSVDFFFISGSKHGNHGIGNFGQFYPLELIFIITGIWQAVKKRVRTGYLFIGWWLVVIFVAALTREAPHATRSFFLLVPLVFFSSLGLLGILGGLGKIRQPAVKYLIMAIIGGYFAYSIVFYLTSYYIRFPVFYAPQWRGADREVALFIKENEHKYDRVIFDKDAGYIYTSLLFYLSYPPEKFHTSVVRSPTDSEGFKMVKKFAKYEFRDVDWSRDLNNPNTLIVSAPNLIPEAIPILQEVNYPERPVVVSIGQQIAQYPVKEPAYFVIGRK